MKRRQKRPIEPLTRAECEAMAAIASGGSILATRDLAVLLVLWKSQIRVGELLGLQERDWDQEAGLLNVQRGKGGKQRLVVLSRSVATPLLRWLEWKRLRGLEGPLFCSLTGRQLTRQNVGRMLKRLGRKAGIRKRVNPHLFRHSGTRHLAEARVPLNVIQSQLGHRSISTTNHYVELLFPESRIAAIGALTW